MRSKFFLSILLIVLVGSSCKSARKVGDIESSVSKSQNEEGFCVKSQVVTYVATPDGGALRLTEEINNPVAAPVNINIETKDLANAESIDCKSDGSCIAVINKPVKFDVDVPVAMNAKVTLGFVQEKDGEGAVCMRKVKVGTSVSPFPLCFSKFLSATVDVGVQVTQKLDKNSQKKSYNPEPYCRANFVCSIPFFSVGAHVNEKGIEFDATASLKGLAQNTLVKNSLPAKAKSVHFDYKNMSASLAKFRDSLLAKSSAKSDSSDISWENLDQRCNDSAML